MEQQMTREQFEEIKAKSKMTRGATIAELDGGYMVTGVNLYKDTELETPLAQEQRQQVHFVLTDAMMAAERWMKDGTFPKA